LAGHVGSLGDVIDCRPTDPLLGKELGGGIEKTLADRLTFPFPAPNF
jgi:hypothetical protein